MSGCDIINPDEPIPARIQLNAPVFELQPGQGTAQHKITEFWTFANGSFIGAFAPPTEIHHITETQEDLIFKSFSHRGITFQPNFFKYLFTILSR